MLLAENKERRVASNVIAGIFQTLISALLLLLLYRFLLDHLGSSALGLWSLFVALFSLSKIVDVGFTGAGLKLMAESMAREEFNDARCYARLSIMGTGILTIPVIVLFTFLLHEFGHGDHVEIWSILTIGLAVWISFIVQSLRSGIDALHRMDLKHATVSLQALILYVLCLYLVPKYEWEGLLIAYLVSTCFSGLILGIILWKLWTKVPFGGPETQFSTLRKSMIKYGLPFQLTSISVQFYDPVTKYFLATFGTLSDVGWYEMASRLVLQFRALQVSAMEVMVPYVAANKTESVNQDIAGIYLPAVRLFLTVGVPLFSSFIVLVPFISYVWIGSENVQFILFSQILIVAWTINTFSTPAYFFSQGQGRQRWTLFAHVLIAFLNCLFAILLGSYFGAVGVVLGFFWALIIGSVIQMMGFHFDNKVNFGALNQNKMLVRSAMIKLLACSICVWYYIQSYFSLWSIYMIGISSAVIFGLLPFLEREVRSVLSRILHRVK